MRHVVVFDGAQPWIRLLAWFLQEAGYDVTRVRDEASVLAALVSHPASLLILNAAAGPLASARLVDAVCRDAPDARIVVLLHRAHMPGETPLTAHVCVHAVFDAQTAVDEIARVLRSDAALD